MYAGMSNADLMAIYAYLRTVEQKVETFPRPSKRSGNRRPTVAPGTCALEGGGGC